MVNSQYKIETYSVDAIVYGDIFKNKIKYMLKKQIKISIEIDNHRKRLINISPTVYLYGLGDRIFFKSGEWYYGIKKSELKDIAVKC